MNVNGRIETDGKIIAKKFNIMYQSQYTIPGELKKIEHKLRNERAAPMGNTHLDRMFEKAFSIQELNEAIRNTKNKKQPGDDQIFPEMVKNLGPAAKQMLLDIYNDFWVNDELTLLADWTKAVVIPLLKPGKHPNEMESYRPIALTPILAKIMEKMVTERLNWYLENQNQLMEEQAGFRTNMSTSNALTRLVQSVKDGFHKKKSTLAVFVDFKGAYDTVWREKLIAKLKSYNVRRRMLNWYKRFLQQRWVKTRWEGHESRFKQSKVGLPQGAASSTTLFNVYINDLPKKLQTIPGIEVSMFADDVVLWAAEKTQTRNKRKS